MVIKKLRMGIIPVAIVLQAVILCSAVSTIAPTEAPPIAPTPKAAPITVPTPAPTKPVPTQPPPKPITTATPKVSAQPKPPASMDPAPIEYVVADIKKGQIFLTNSNHLSLRIPREELFKKVNINNAPLPKDITTPAPVTGPAWSYHYNAYYFGWVVALVTGANLIMMVAFVLACLKKFKKSNTYSPGAKTLKEDTIQH